MPYWLPYLPPPILEQIAVLVATTHPLPALAVSTCPPVSPSLLSLQLLDEESISDEPSFLSSFHLIANTTATSAPVKLLGFRRRYRLVETDLVVEDDRAYRRTNAAPCDAIKKISFHILRMLVDVPHQVASIRYRVHTLGTSLVVTYNSKVDPGIRPVDFTDLHIHNDVDP